MTDRFNFTSEYTFHQFRMALGKNWSDRKLPRVKPPKGKELKVLPTMLGHPDPRRLVDPVALMCMVGPPGGESGFFYAGWIKWLVPQRSEGALWRLHVEDVQILAALFNRGDHSEVMQRLYAAVKEPIKESPIPITWPLIRKYSLENGYSSEHVSAILNQLELIHKASASRGQPSFGLSRDSTGNYMVDLRALVEHLETPGHYLTYLNGKKSRRLLRGLLDQQLAARQAHDSL